MCSLRKVHRLYPASGGSCGLEVAVIERHPFYWIVHSYETGGWRVRPEMVKAKLEWVRCGEEEKRDRMS
jgi:hypothetical protein